MHVKKDSLKSESDLSQPQFAWPLNLVWLTRHSDNRVEIKNPTESIIFEDAELWGQSLEEALKQHIYKVRFVVSIYALSRR